MVQLRENRVKHKLDRGQIATVVGGLNTADMVDYLGQFGLDGAWIETEHGAVDFADIPDVTRACDLWGMTSIVRVNLNIPSVIYRTLDVGAQGIVVPHVNTADEARTVVEGAKFAPIGARGQFTSRQGYGVDGYKTKANDETLVVVLIEDIVAVNNLGDILDVDHIDVFFVAPGDLSQSMGHFGEMGQPEVLATVDRALEQIVSAGRVAGTLTNDSNIDSYIDKGVQFLMSNWGLWVEAGAKSYLQKIAAISK